MDAREFQQWQFELSLVEKRLTAIEQQERAILEAMGCPADPLKIWDMLDGRIPAPWRGKTAERDKHRARRAMFLLHLVDMIRTALSPGHERPLVAVCHALDAALRAAESWADQATSRRQSAAGKASGEKRAENAAEETRAAVEKFKSPPPAGVLAQRLGRNRATIHRRLKKPLQ